MYRACIAVVDASRARLFTFDRISDAGRIHEELLEQRDLINPARRLRPVQLFSESRPPTGQTGNLQYGLDDHRDAHIDELDAAFSRTIVDELADLVRSSHAQRLIVCASPRMLGDLRSARGEQDSVPIDEIPRDLVKLTPSQLREHLASYGVLPEPPPRPGLA